MPNKVSSGERIRTIMHERGLRQVDVITLAQPFCKQYDIKFSKSTLSQYLSNAFEPAQDKLFILGLVFDVNEAWLMGFDVPKERGGYLTSPECDPTEKIFILEQKLSKMMQPVADRYVDLFIKILDQDANCSKGPAYITVEDGDLISAWHRADPKEKQIIAKILEEYGFVYNVQR